VGSQKTKNLILLRFLGYGKKMSTMLSDSQKTTSFAKVTPVASFPPYTFLENIAVRHDGSILVTAINPKALYYLPRPQPEEAIAQCLHTFDQSTMGIAELEPDIFYITTSTLFEDSPNTLWRLDMRSFSPSDVSKPVTILRFPSESCLLNGTAVLSSTVMLCADSWADLIWRVDIPQDGRAPSARIWLKHDMLAHSLDPKKHEVPGVNGLKFNAKDMHLYFTTTAQTILGRVRIDPGTLDPAGDPEDVTRRWMWGDDLILDEDAGVAYVTTHRQNTIEIISLNTGIRHTVAREPINPDMIGPTAGSWGRDKGDAGRVAYFSTDGGIKNPLGGVVRESKVLRVELPAITPQGEVK
jgi:hypothetical protein